MRGTGVKQPQATVSYCTSDYDRKERCMQEKY